MVEQQLFPMNRRQTEQRSLLVQQQPGLVIRSTNGLINLADNGTPLLQLLSHQRVTSSLLLGQPFLAQLHMDLTVEQALLRQR